MFRQLQFKSIYLKLYLAKLNLKILIQKPTIKEGIVKIIKEGQDPIVKYIWNMKEIKELI